MRAASTRYSISNEPTSEDADELSKLIERFTRILLDAPDEVHASLVGLPAHAGGQFFSTVQHGQGAAEGEAEADSKEGRMARRLLPRLTRFYGIGPSDILRLPAGLFRQYVEMLPRLIAEEISDGNAAGGDGVGKHERAGCSQTHHARVGEADGGGQARPPDETVQKPKADPAAMARRRNQGQGGESQ